MSDGKWELTLLDGTTRVIPIKSLGKPGETEPLRFETTTGIEFHYEDGRRVVWPWGVIEHAEYTPPSVEASYRVVVGQIRVGRKDRARKAYCWCSEENPHTVHATFWEGRHDGLHFVAANTLVEVIQFA